MLGLLFVALFQTVAGEPAVAPDGEMGASAPVEQTEPVAPTTPTIPEVVETPATEGASTPAAPAQPRTERVCRYERGGGSSRTSRTLVCRDVVVRGEEADEDNPS